MRFSFLSNDGRRRALVAGLIGVLAGCAIIHGGTARAGEPAPAADTERGDVHLPPSLLISIRTQEPESLPTASIAMERLLYDLNRRRHQFSDVSAEFPDPPRAVRRLYLQITLHRLGPEQAKLHWWWPPITQREDDGQRVMFAGQLPVQVELTLTNQHNGEQYAKTAFIAQSTGRTITAGTTDATGVLIARRIEKYLHEQRRAYAAR